MAVFGCGKLYPKPADGEKIEIQPIALMQATKYWDPKANRRIIVQGWDGQRLDLPEREEIYQLFAWNATYNIPAIIDMPKGILERYSMITRLQKQHGGKILFTRIRKNGKLIPHFEHVPEDKGRSDADRPT